jgi:hypothetical protein
MHQIDLQDTAQSDLDRWLVDHPSLHRTVVTFVQWVVARRITGKLAISRPSRKSIGSGTRRTGQDASPGTART